MLFKTCQDNKSAPFYVQITRSLDSILLFFHLAGGVSAFEESDQSRDREVHPSPLLPAHGQHGRELTCYAPDPVPGGSHLPWPHHRQVSPLMRQRHLREEFKSICYLQEYNNFRSIVHLGQDSFLLRFSSLLFLWHSFWSWVEWNAHLFMCIKDVLVSSYSFRNPFYSYRYLSMIEWYSVMNFTMASMNSWWSLLICIPFLSSIMTNVIFHAASPPSNWSS